MSRVAWAGGAFALILLAGGGGYAWLQGSGEGEPEEKDRTVRVRFAPLRQVVREIGHLQPVVKIEVKPEISGRVSEILADVGDAAKTGQVLVRLDDRILLNQLEQARIKLGQARLTEDKHCRNLERPAQHSEGGPALIPREELEQARTDYEMAVASRRDAENTVKNMEDQLRHTAIASPMDGLLIERGVSVGDVVIGTSSAGAPTTLVTVADTKRMQVVIEVNEVDYPKVASGQAVELKTSSRPDRTLRGKVVSVGLSGHPDAKNKNVITYTVKAEVEDPSGSLRAGMTATADIITQEKEKALIIPREAVGLKDGKPFAIRVKDGKGESVDLATGLESENEVEVLSGLAEGEEVRLGAWTASDWEAYHKAQRDRRDQSMGRRHRRGNS